MNTWETYIFFTRELMLEKRYTDTRQLTKADLKVIMECTLEYAEAFAIINN